MTNSTISKKIEECTWQQEKPGKRSRIEVPPNKQVMSSVAFSSIRRLVADEELRESEVRIVIRPMVGDEYVVAVAEWEDARRISAYMGEVLDVDWERIRLCLNYQPLAQDELVGCLLSELEKSEHVIDVLVDEPVVRKSSQPFALIGRPLYGSGISTVGSW
jgi:hypothetical protein